MRARPSWISQWNQTIPLLTPGNPGYTAYTSDVVLTGTPDAVARPRSEQEISDLLTRAHAERVPVTPAGGFTGLAGGAVAERGLLLATEKMDALLDIGVDPHTGGHVAVVQPGIFLGSLQKVLEDAGWFYPPDPTSRHEARLGATVATNATGEDTLFYGPTRRWIRELRVVTADGSVRELRRSADRLPPTEEKATAGYFLGGEEIDGLIGSEGTLGVITQVTLDLIPRPDAMFAGMAFFPTLLSALRFVVAARQSELLTPRALELIDRAALDLVGPNPEGITWPDATGAAVVFKQEYADDASRLVLLEGWVQLLDERLQADGHRELLDAVLVMEDRPGQDRLRTFRHRIPSRLNEVVATKRAAGGGKVGTDWWVPYPEIPDFLESWRRRIAESGLRAVMFGHIGNGHPHVNFIPENTGEKERARGLLLEMCREAVAKGGGVAGEHGLGKLKRDLLPIQYAPQRIAAMRELKHAWDPLWILGRGNILAPELP